MNKDEALRLALEAMKINNKAWKLLADSGDAGNWEAEEQGYYQLNEQAIKAIKEALETKDDPVAWYCKEGLKRGVSLKQESPEWTPLYTTPQRTWVGLTDAIAKDEALRLALEALESTGENDGYHGINQYFDNVLVNKAINAIKEALEIRARGQECLVM